jgi:hypothetical protein
LSEWEKEIKKRRLPGKRPVICFIYRSANVHGHDDVFEMIVTLRMDQSGCVGGVGFQPDIVRFDHFKDFSQKTDVESDQ